MAIKILQELFGQIRPKLVFKKRERVALLALTVRGGGDEKKRQVQGVTTKERPRRMHFCGNFCGILAYFASILGVRMCYQRHDGLMFRARLEDGLSGLLNLV
jgi:hypothetical protein